MSGPTGAPAGHRRVLGLWQAIDAYHSVITQASATDLAGRGSIAHYLRTAALESHLARTMRARAIISVHHALLAGAHPDEVARALGTNLAEVAQQWLVWAHSQRLLRQHNNLLGLAEADYVRVRAVLAQAGALDHTMDSKPRAAPARQIRPPAAMPDRPSDAPTETSPAPDAPAEAQPRSHKPRN